MNWGNLKQKNCPNCGQPLKFSYGQMIYYCPENKPEKQCFVISVGKMKKILPKQESLLTENPPKQSGEN